MVINNVIHCCGAGSIQPEVIVKIKDKYRSLLAALDDGNHAICIVHPSIHLLPILSATGPASLACLSRRILTV